MKRFAAREMALLCSPLLVVGVAGFVLSRRKAPPPPAPLHAVFRVDTPTVLEAFDGADTVMNIELQGAGASSKQIWQSDYRLEVQTPTKIEKSSDSCCSGFWQKVWKGNYEDLRFPVDSHFIPHGPLTFYWTGSVAPQSGVTLPQPKLPHLSGRWKIDRTKIKPFAFNKLARAPLIVLRWVKVTQTIPNDPINLTAECVFDLTGAAMNEKTATEFRFSGSAPLPNGATCALSRGTTMSGKATQENATRRVREWNIECVPGGKVHVSGRVSADNRWPLAFQIAPFDVAKVKVGQKLRFKAWPAPIPKGAG